VRIKIENPKSELQLNSGMKLNVTFFMKTFMIVSDKDSQRALKRYLATMNGLLHEDMSSDEPGTVRDPALSRILGKFRTFKGNASKLEKHELQKLKLSALKKQPTLTERELSGLCLQ